MAEQQDQDKTEQPTPFKLREAKNRGQVAKSMELNSLTILSAMLFLSFLLAHPLMNNYLSLSQVLLSYDSSSLAEPEGLLVLLEQMLYALINLFWPVIAVLVLVSVLSNMVQTGPIFSFFPLKPDMQRMNPIKGFKRIFSKRMLYEAIKTFIKLLLFSIVAYLCIVGFLPTFLNYLDISPNAYGLRLVASAQELVAKMLLVILLVALIDIIYTRWDYMKQMRMSRKELKDEVKRREGDPLIRAKRRELQQQALERSKALKNVPDADVLITNPTHLSIALKFDQQNMSAPQTTAKGSGEIAKKMREIARKHHVPVVENKPLAQMLFRKIEVNESIREEMYPLVAKIYAWIQTQQQVRA